jgi:hypothetical protein
MVHAEQAVSALREVCDESRAVLHDYGFREIAAERDTAGEAAFIARRREQLRLVARAHGLADALRQIPGLEQHLGKAGVIAPELRDFVGDPVRVRGGLRQLPVEIARCAVERQHCHVLEQGSEEDVFGVTDFRGLAERPGRGGGKQRAAPEPRVVDADRPQRAHGRNQRKAQRQGQRGVQADDHQRLAQVLARPALGVERRIRDSQDFGGHRRVAADRLGHFRHLDVRIAGERDDFRGDSRRAREVHLCFQAVFEVWRQHSVAVIGGSGRDLSLRGPQRGSESSTCC